MRRLFWCVLPWFVGLLVTPALAEARDDDDTPDDRESGSFVDDGEPVGDAPSEPLCFLEPPTDVWLAWTLGTNATFSLPPAGTGNTWTIEYRARGRNVDISWTESGQGSPTAAVTETLTPPPSVVNAAATTPLSLTARVAAKDTSNTEVDVRHVKWLILDKRSGNVQYERWDDHTWPTVTNQQGTIFPITDLDWDPETAIRTTLDGSSAEETGNTEEASEEGTFFPEDLLGSPSDSGLDAEPSALAVTDVLVTFCVELQVNFFNVGSFSANQLGNRDDYFNTNSDKYARGHWVYASGPASGGQMYGWATSEANAAQPGCATLVLKQGSHYDIWVRADLVVDLQTAAVRRQPGNAPWQGRVLTNYVAPTSYTLEEATTATPHQAWMASSVASYGMYRRFVPDFTNVSLYTDVSCPVIGGACADGREVYISPGNQADRFVIAHETGHVVGYVTDDSRSPDDDYGVVGAAVCRSTPIGHAISSKEYASAAAVEGFGNYWAAVVFNNTSESDCALEWFTQDFDGDLAPDGDGRFMQMLSCEARPYWGTTPTYVETSGDHLGFPCDGVKPNRGTEYDWLRMFWDLDSQGLSFSQILEVWDRANPKSWRETDTGSNDKPWERVIDAAIDVGVVGDFVTIGSQNGTDRL